MIKAILLIIEPSRTWENILLAQRSLVRVLLLFLTPTILLSVGGELAGIAYWGRQQGHGVTVQIPQAHLLVYGAVQLVLNFAVVFIAAKMIKSFTGTFQNRYTYASAFSLVAYCLSPLFLLHLLDALPAINPWVSYGIGIVLSIATLYNGVPRMLQPDPPHAFGVFLTSALMLAGMTALARLTSLLVIMGPIKEFNPGG